MTNLCPAGRSAQRSSSVVFPSGTINRSWRVVHQTNVDLMSSLRLVKFDLYDAMHETLIPADGIRTKSHIFEAEARPVVYVAHVRLLRTRSLPMMYANSIQLYWSEVYWYRMQEGRTRELVKTRFVWNLKFRWIWCKGEHNKESSNFDASFIFIFIYIHYQKISIVYNTIRIIIKCKIILLRSNQIILWKYYFVGGLILIIFYLPLYLLQILNPLLNFMATVY